MFGSLVVVGSLVAGVGTLSLVARLWEYRRRPGASLFVGALVCQALFCLGYGAALLTAAPLWRRLLEAAVLATLPAMAVLFLGFAFGYTGRDHLLRTWWYRLPLATAALLSGLLVSAPAHELVWRAFTITSVGTAAGASYTHEPVLFVAVGFSMLWVVLGTMLLFDTVVSYGPLFRGEAIAVGFSPLAPGLAMLLWLFEAGPTALNLTAVAFVPHVLLDGYAFVKRDMFEFLPGTRRAGERAAIRDLGSPVVIVDTDGRIVSLNAAAETLIDLAEDDALTRPLGAVLDAEVDLGGERQRLTLRNDGERREFVLTPAELTDTAGAQVGYTLVFQDVTEAIQREQRLTVMNRVLRHNLRNDLNVVHGTIEAGKDQIEDDDALARMFDRAAEKAWGLVETGEKVREIESVMENAGRRKPVALAPTLTTVVAEYDDEGVVEVDVPDSLTVETDPDLLGVVVQNLVENALEHGTTEGGTVRLRATDRGDSVEISVRDDGPGIPQNELATIDAGTETDLVHGSGLGLWIVTWGVRQLGGEVDFDSSEDGTTVTVSLPS